MSTFPERYGYVEARTVVQRESIDDDTRTLIWNLIYALITEIGNISSRQGTDGEDDLAMIVYSDFLKYPLDEYNVPRVVWKLIKKVALDEQWYRLFELVEFMLKPKLLTSQMRDRLAIAINNELEANLVGYRVIDDKVTPIDSQEEADAITKALRDATSHPLNGVRHHLSTSIKKLADREHPDYANSIKESISAVEAIAELITGENILSKAIRKLPSSGIAVHPALLEAWVKMYGWTSDENGVRHSAAAVPTVDQATAKYMLVTCSAFVSWLIEEGSKAGKF